MSTESTEQFRAGFEAWARGNNMDVRRAHHSEFGVYLNEYYDERICVAWRAWIAAKRDALPASGAGIEPSIPSDDAIERAALKHVAKQFGDLFPGLHYRNTEQFDRLKAFAHELAGAGALRDEAKEAARLEAFIDWYLRGGARSEIHPYGHIEQTTREIVLASLDAAIAAHKGQAPGTAAETMDHDQLGKLGQYYANGK